jgi:monoamine oxidase
MNRRQLLKLFALGASSLLTRSFAQRSKKVIVVGAGIAGIAAARRLQTAGFEVMVLEARDRIGGRIWTDTSLGFPLDLGASWIHGVTNNPIFKIARDNTIETSITDYDNSAVFEKNIGWLDDETVTAMEDLLGEVVEGTDTLREELESDLSLREGLNRVIQTLDLSPKELMRLEAALNTNLEHEYATSLSQLSLFYFDNAEAFDGNDVLFPGGYNQISTFLSTGLDIRLGHIVHEIRYDISGVHVVTNQGTFEADYTVVTLPLGVLKVGSVKFAPALPREKLNAIAALEMGVLNKTYLHFPTTFWQEDIELFNYISNETGQWAEWLNLHYYTNKAVLLGFNAADFGREIESYGDAEIIEHAMTALRTMHGTNIPNPRNYLVSRWASDPFALGSYSFLPVGSSPDMLDALASSVDDKLFFAGEATSRDYQATVHGAYLSGLRAAEEIMEL